MDLGHKLTDEALAKLERKIKSAYKLANDEIEQYFAEFDERSKAQKAKFENGEITEQEYKRWRLNEATKGKHYKAIQKSIAEQMNNADKIAVDYINGSMPDIYALNRNYAAYSIEQADLSASFDLVDGSTVKRLIEEDPKLLPNYPPKKAIDFAENSKYFQKQVTKQVTTGILLGESNDDIALRLIKNIPNMGKVSAVRNARTATTSAECAGRQDTYESAKAMGIVLKKEWQSAHDARTRDAHIAADGQKVEVEQPFIVGGERLMKPGDPSGSGWNIYNCFSGDIKVASDSKAIRSYKHEYNGDLICIKTSAGVEFTCTPNHPILTPDGWVSANAFNKGDDILITIVGNNMLFGRNPDIEHIFPSFSAFHKSIKMFRGQRTIALGVDFHGDIAATDVEVVTQKGFLPENGDTSRFKSLRKFIFKHTYISLACKSAFMEHFRRICKPSFSLISFKRILFSFFKSHIAHSNIHRFGTTSNMNICLPEYSINNLPTETIIRSKLLNGFTAKVFVDKVVDVKIISSNSHVYNLQTENGYYFVNSIIPQNGSKVNGIFAIAKNCRCTTVADVDTKASAKNKNPVSFNKWVEQKSQESVSKAPIIREKQKNIQAEKYYSAESLKNMSRDKIIEIAEPIFIKNNMASGLSESEAKKRFKLLLDGNTTPQLRKYITKHQKR